MTGRFLFWSAALTLAFCLPHVAQAQELFPPEDTSLADVPPVENIHQAIYFLNVQRSMEEDFLRNLYERYQAKRVEEQGLFDELRALYYDVDSLLASRASPEREEGLRDALERLDALEAHLVQLTIELKRLRDQMTEVRNRMAQFSHKIAELLASVPEEATDLTGTWLVSLEPLQLVGEMRLFQNGIMVSGTYLLSGGWRGNVRGYVAGGQAVLERYDAQLGRAGEFVAVLSDDGKSLAGRWSNYVLSEGPSVGSFTAKRLKR
ncbi:MAG: hypothetical protein JSV08_08735 [Acidobacteriota bacterium]|nr:MAG: hypothetical protein JSV08_08735 [Acidobacteriota bacterium]